jgi:diphthamide biosynthesis enzyme Dph1/Dph2-like protein
MKVLFFPTKTKFELDEEKIKEFPEKGKIFLAYSIQYKEIAEKIKSILKNEITGFSQILGCSKLKIPKETKAIILVSSGRFHAVSLAYETSKDVYLFEHNNFIKINEKEIEQIRNKKKASYSNFLNSEKIGILISTKPGQEKLNQALKIKERINKKFPEKKVYLFLSNNIDFNEFENFDIQSWVNSACPRLDFDDSNNNMINISELSNSLK